MIVAVIIGLVIGAAMSFVLYRAGDRGLRLSQGRHRLGRLAGPTRGDFLLSEGLPIANLPPPDKMQSTRRALAAGLRWDEASRCYVASNGRRITEEAWEAIS